MASNNDWTWNDYDILYREVRHSSYTEIGDRLGRATQSVIFHANKLNIYGRLDFTAEEIRLAKSYGKQLGEALMFILPSRTRCEIEELLKCAEVS